MSSTVLRKTKLLAYDHKGRNFIKMPMYGMQMNVPKAKLLRTTTKNLLSLGFLQPAEVLKLGM
jgi:hypothetical protein